MPIPDIMGNVGIYNKWGGEIFPTPFILILSQAIIFGNRRNQYLFCVPIN